MRITDEQITTNIPEPSEPFQLNKRRPDLAQIPLTCENTNTLVPYLDIVNKVLALKVDGFNHPNSSTTEDQKIDNAYKFLATASYPFNLPFNLPLEQIRRNLRQLNINLATIYQTFNGEEKHIAREYLGLSIEEYSLITTPKTTNDDLSKVYGVDVSTANLGGLINVDTFLSQTGLSRQELNDLLYQNLSPEEIGKKLAHNFYINQVLPDNQYISYSKDNLVARWPLNEGSGTTIYDLAGNNNGTIQGTANWQTEPNFKGGSRTVLQFDGENNYIQLPAMNFDYSQGFTVAAWVYYDEFKKHSRIIEFGNGQSDNIILFNSETTADLCFCIRVNRDSRFIANNVLETSNWMYIVATVDSSGIGKIYKNGQLVKSDPLQVPINVNRESNLIGGTNFHNSEENFKGKMAEVCIWNVALSEEQIKANYNNCNSTTTINLNLKTLDRINRFVRFAKKLNWSFADLDWVLHSIGVTGTQDIDENAIKQIAKIKQIVEALKLPLDVVCSFVSDLKTIGVGDPKNSQALFDVIFNNNKLLQGKAPYHPTYNGNPLYKDTPPTTADLNNKTRVAAGLGISLDDLTALINAFLSNNQSLDVPNLSILYRHSKLASILRLTIEQYLILLQLINKKKPVFTIQELIEILDHVTWLSNLGFNVYELDYIVNGNESKSISNKYKNKDIKSFLQTPWNLKIDLQSELKVSDIIDWHGFILRIKASTQDGPSQRIWELFSQDIQHIITTKDFSDLTEDDKNQIIQGLNLTFKRRDFYQEDKFRNIVISSYIKKLLTSSEISLMDNEIYTLNLLIFSASFSQQKADKQDKLMEQLATFLGESTEIITAFLELTNKFILLPSGFTSYIDVFLTPLQDSEFNDNNQSWQYIKLVLHSLSRFLLLNQKLQLSQTEINSIIQHPSCYGISFPQPSSITDVQINIGDVKKLYTFKQLLKAFNDGQDQLIQYFSLKDRLFSYWPLKEGEGNIIHDLASNNKGTLRDQALWQSATNFPGGSRAILQFNSLQNPVQFPLTNSVVNDNEFTISFWSGSDQCVISWLINNNQRLIVKMGFLDEKNIGFSSNYSSSNSQNTIPIDYLSNYKGKWLHWAFTRNGTNGEMKLYLNGKILYSSRGESPDTVSINQLLCYSKAQIAEVHIWNKALRADEVQFYYNNPNLDDLAKITGWKQEQIDDLVKNNHNFSISSVEGIAKFKQAFDLSHALGVDISFFEQILALQNLEVDGTNWTTYTNTAQVTTAILKAKYNDENWAKISDKINGEIDELKRDALTTFTLWKLNQQNQQDNSIKNLRDLSEYLLIDVETTDLVSVSYIKQAILSVQMYLQRCRLNLEPGVNNVNIPEVWWEWMMNYRVWEANRKVFLYPENYIEPNLRKSKSDLFQEFEAELLQSDITQESVEAAYHNYFDKLAELAKLKIAATYRCFINKANNSNPVDVDTLFIFGKTTTEPVTYYYRECPVKKGQTYNEDSIIWDYWAKIDVNIKSDYISPVFAFNKLFIFWVEIEETTETTSNNGTTKKTTKQTATIKYTFQTVSKKWMQPQTLSQYIDIPSYGLMWKEAYPISISVNNSEEILTSWGNFKSLQDSYQFDQPATILSANLLKDSKNLAINSQILLNYPKIWAENLVAYWPLDEGSGTTTYDKIGNSNGTIQGPLPWTSATKFPGGSRKVLRFDGTYNYIELPTMNFDFSQGFTVAAWVYYYDFKNHSRIIEFGNGTSDSIALFNDGTTGKLTFFIPTSEYDRITTDNNVLQTNTWMYLVATVNSSKEAKIYIDGELKKSGNLNVPKNVKRESNLIGGSNWKASGEERFKGQIAEVRIWNKAFNDAEIAFLKQISSILLKNNISLLTVKNQPDWFTFDSGDEAFLVIPPNSQTKPINEDLTISPSDSQITLSYNGSPTTVSNFQFIRLTTNILSNLSQKAFMGGIDHLLTLDSQRTPELSFSRLNLPPTSCIQPTHKELDFHGAFGLYFQEIFFHIPFLVANTLNTNQRFAEAQKWYHYIFNPTQKNDSTNPSDRFWRYLPFRNNTLESLQSLLCNQQVIAAYNNDPFDPHAIAQLRIGAYQKAIVMKYIDNLLDWGDNLFAQDNWESITQATMLYLLAYDLLGPKPENLGKCKVPQPATFQDIKNKYQQEIPQFLIELENKLANSPTPILNSTPFNDINAYFGVSENEQFIAYWDRVEDRLYKIRHSQNIEGIMRQLALYEPPIDPSQIVRAVAGGNVPMSVVSGLTADVPHYRFEYMLERARNLVSTVIQLGSSLLSALEKKDAEQISLLRATQESAMLRLIQTTREKQIKEAEENLNSLNKSLDAASHRVTHFQTLINGGLNTGEISGIALAGTAIGFETTATIFNTLAAPAYLIPNIYGLADGGMNFGAAVATLGAASSGIANTLNQGSALAGTIAQYQRRAEDWQLQLQMAQDDVTLINQQIVASQINLEIATLELKTHQKSIEQANEVEDFFKNKFSNQDLYQWMVSRLSLLYFQTFKIALEMTLSAQKAYQYELNKDDTYITFNYWDSLKKGLLAGEGLMFGLNQLEKAYIEGNQRRLEIEKTISLKELLGENFDNGKTQGKWEFELIENLFEDDYPGHYCRQIKTISISIPAVVGPYQNIKATLTQLSDTIYLGKNESKPRKSWRRNQKIALSKGVNDSGLFELNFRDERYLPFEGTGAISSWELTLPKNTNSESILHNLSDIIIHLSYTALDEN